MQKEGEAAMLASINKQVALLKIIYFQNHKSYRSLDIWKTNICNQIYQQMEVQLTELEAIKTKLITERNDVAAVVRKEFAENLDRLTDENSRMATELQNQVRKNLCQIIFC